MTREEEIEKILDEEFDTDFYDYPTDNSYCNYRAGFIEGARWADNHPINVWHDASEEPKIGSNIVAINGNDKWWDIHPYDGDYSWRSWVSSYDIQRWAYIDDLLPKGGGR